METGRKLTVMAMVVFTTVSVQAASAAAQSKDVRAEESHHADGFDFDRWKPLVVLYGFVDVAAETATLRGQNFGRQKPTVFCETQKMTVLRWSATEVVVRFPDEVAAGTYLFTVARGNINLERGAFFLTKSNAGGGGGERGAQGPAGPAGPTGPQGIPGADGPAGPTGPAGPAGPTGPAGPEGPAGPQGPAGATGATGPAGANGAAGAQGATGPQGPAGANGGPGLTGPQGPAGEPGPAGAPGEPGGLTGYEVVAADTVFASISNGAQTVPAVVACSDGKRPLGGGFEPLLAPVAPSTTPTPGPGPSNRMFLASSAPTQAGWSVSFRNGTGSTLTSVWVRVWAICAVQP